ncbi:hypothetical protein Pan241w_18020 [Gimesia alba]|uniref:Nickel uptake substrate-specific transmembrane region n=1 Tax=Gimesia alba TaxID=2527973 RepID=A0A517RCY1_9PLAN|nr:hypothetical protein [Gimesia alba]QDT41739.1 hypothetical protein Pan241w_18020 [Gimesia alba]
MMQIHVPTILVVFSLVHAVGCGNSVERPKTVPVSGKVTWNGAPLSMGRVQFVPSDSKKGRPAVGDINQEGHYTLMTFQANDGVMPGNYKIFVDARKEGDPNNLKTKGGFPILPQKYYDANKSGLTAFIEDSAKNKVVDIVLDGKRKK